MAYTISYSLAIYFVVWWIVLFVTLPFGVKSQYETGEGARGTDPGAPIFARMRAKLIWTTILSSVLFGGGLFAFRQGWLSVERLTKMMGFPF